MKKIVINADDFGLTPNVNSGIMTAHKSGVVTSASIIPTGAAFEEAVKLARETPSLAVGIHLDLDKFFTINHEKGYVTGWAVQPPPLEEIKAEIRKQIETVKSTGLSPDHLSSHHHPHLDPLVMPIAVSIAKEYGICCMRFFRKFYKDQKVYDGIKKIIEDNNIFYTPHFIEGWYWGNIDEAFNVAELVTHPGYGELWREYELSACCNPQLKVHFQQSSIVSTTFRELRELSAK